MSEAMMRRLARDIAGAILDMPALPSMGAMKAAGEKLALERLTKALGESETATRKWRDMMPEIARSALGLR